jgi:pyridoxal 5'-phosphate synthase pdxT subunit
MVLIGVLALQGSFQEHIEVLKRAGANAMEVRTTEDLQKCAGLIIPGGESTTMAQVANKTGMLTALKEYVVVQQKPVWGTCAGLIFLAETAEGEWQVQRRQDSTRDTALSLPMPP